MNLAQYKRPEKPKPIRAAGDLEEGHALFFGGDMDIVGSVKRDGNAVYVESRGGEPSKIRFGAGEKVEAFSLLPLGSDEL